MSETMTAHERYSRIFNHQEADRIPISDSPWGATIERWQKEGLPRETNWVDYFDLDKHGSFRADTSPRYEARTIEETEEYRIFTTAWGATLKDWKHAATVPEFIDFTITSPEAWAGAKARMTPTRDRLEWDSLKRDYPQWRAERRWIVAGGWFGFDVTHSWMVGTERVLMAMHEEPEWMVDMWNHQLDMNIALYDMAWDEGYTFDAFAWPDDMGYKGKTFFSLDMYREMLKPVQKRAVDWCHAKGVKACLHSCGDVHTLIPDLLEVGIDSLNPLEVKAGMDPVAIKKEYGDKLVLHGGVNAVLWDEPEKIEAEMRRVIPELKKNGGYVFASDHSIPSSVSLEDMTRIIKLIKELGRYD